MRQNSGKKKCICRTGTGCSKRSVRYVTVESVLNMIQSGQFSLVLIQKLRGVLVSLCWTNQESNQGPKQEVRLRLKGPSSGPEHVCPQRTGRFSKCPVDWDGSDGTVSIVLALLLRLAVSSVWGEGGRRPCRTPPAWTPSPSTGRGQTPPGRRPSPSGCRRPGRPGPDPWRPAGPGSGWSSSGTSSGRKREAGDTEDRWDRGDRWEESECAVPPYLTGPPSVLVQQLQTEGGVVPAGVLHASVPVLVGTFDLQAEQPAARLLVHHDAVWTGRQPGTLAVDEQAAVQNRDGPAQRRRLQLLGETSAETSGGTNDDVASTLLLSNYNTHTYISVSIFQFSYLIMFLFPYLFFHFLLF